MPDLTDRNSLPAPAQSARAGRSTDSRGPSPADPIAPLPPKRESKKSRTAAARFSECRTTGKSASCRPQIPARLSWRFGPCSASAASISDDRGGLTICDATSAAFAMDLAWDKLDVVTWSWQKVLGGEAAHGMLALSPRAVARLESYTPPWPMPKIFRLTKGGKLNASIFEGSTINTPSMICVEDAVDSLVWAESIGGLEGLIGRSQANLDAVTRWVESSDWVGFLCEDEASRSSTSICLKITDPWAAERDDDVVAKTVKAATKRLDQEGIAFDIGSYRDAPTGLRLWGGATVDTADLERLFAWLDWAWSEAKSEA